MTPVPHSPSRSVNKDWVRALKCVSTIEQEPHRVLARAFEDVARERGDAPAIIGKNGGFTFLQLAAISRRYARWGLSLGLRKGDRVALMMESRPEYVAIWLGLTQVGIVVALINDQLAGGALAHCIRIANPRIVICSPEFRTRCESVLSLKEDASVIAFDDAIARQLEALPDGPLGEDEFSLPTLSDHALYIYTSGTTGLPKAAIVSHRRIMNWALWFRGLMDVTPDDRMYNCLPLYHSVGGVVAVWATLLGGGSVFLRARFSASAFWRDICEYRCTLFQYIGELCRYLAHAPSCEAETRHGLRLAVGNGLRPEVWPLFQSRFGIPRILEFYAATESNFSLYNVEGELGSIGRIPSFVAARDAIRLVRIDPDTEQPLRGEDGRCVSCGPEETGEAISRIAGDFEGYLDLAATERKILRDVFTPGDAWMRSGDLMRKDARGFYYFVDRIGDTFRWKGENVATAEVAGAIASYPGVVDVSVYGVEVPGREGRAGMAALVTDDNFHIGGLYAHLADRLPTYARPAFLRLMRRLEVTETFKHRKRELAAQGFDPAAVPDPVFFVSSGRSIYVALDLALYAGIISGAVSL